MSRAPAVKTVKHKFGSAVTSSLHLYGQILPLTPFTAANIKGPIHPKNARRIVGLSFLAMLSAWEEFVEDVLIRYCAGADHPDGTLVNRRIGPCRSLAHAYQALSGREDYDPESHFLSFRPWSKVVRLAAIWFEEGAPFSVVKDWRQQRLDNAYILRDRVAHRSDKAIAAFKVVAREHRGLGQSAPLGQGYDVGSLLIAPAARGFPGYGTATYFEAYARLLRELANLLASG